MANGRWRSTRAPTGAGGLVARSDGGPPTFLADAVADPLTGLVGAATMVDLVGRGGRWVVDLGLSAVAASVAGDERVTASTRPSRPRHRTDPGAPLPLGPHTDAVLAELGIAS